MRGADCSGGGGSDLGICFEPAWNLLVDKDFQPGSDPLAGFLRADADSSGTVPVRPEEMGLLDCVAGGQRRQHHPLPELGTGLYANRQRIVPHQRHLVTLDLV